MNKILNNPLRTGEAGKAVGVKRANGEIIALLYLQKKRRIHNSLLRFTWNE